MKPTKGKQSETAVWCLWRCCRHLWHADVWISGCWSLWKQRNTHCTWSKHVKYCFNVVSNYKYLTVLHSKTSSSTHSSKWYSNAIFHTFEIYKYTNSFTSRMAWRWVYFSNFLFLVNLLVIILLAVNNYYLMCYVKRGRTHQYCLSKQRYRLHYCHPLPLTVIPRTQLWTRTFLNELYLVHLHF